MTYLAITAAALGLLLAIDAAWPTATKIWQTMTQQAEKDMAARREAYGLDHNHQ